jgi:hypothetical protein
VEKKAADNIIGISNDDNSRGNPARTEYHATIMSTPQDQPANVIPELYVICSRCGKPVMGKYYDDEDIDEPLGLTDDASPTESIDPCMCDRGEVRHLEMMKALSDIKEMLDGIRAELARK